VSRAAHPAHTPAPPASSPRRRLGVVVPGAVGLGLAAVLLTGCGSGQITQTDTQTAAVNGGSGTVGPMAVRDAELAYPSASDGTYPPGSSAELIVTIVNAGQTQDTLTGVSSPAVTGVTVDGSPSGTKVIPAGFAVSGGQDYDDASTAPAPTGVVSPVAPPPATTVPDTTTGKHPTSGATPTGALPSGAPGSTEPTTETTPALPGSIAIELTGIKSVNGAPLRAGLSIPVTFRFAQAGEVTVQVPIAAPTDDLNPDTVIDSVPAGS
jgi:copper(I)-binding protein